MYALAQAVRQYQHFIRGLETRSNIGPAVLKSVGYLRIALGATHAVLAEFDRFFLLLIVNFICLYDTCYDLVLRFDQRLRSLTDSHASTDSTVLSDAFSNSFRGFSELVHRIQYFRIRKLTCACEKDPICQHLCFAFDKALENCKDLQLSLY